MKTTAHFKRTIQAYLEQRASEDKLFTEAYRKEGKNIDDCVTYILNEVQRSGCNGFTDGEIYSMAVHYYDEDDIEVGKPVSCQVSVNHVVELTEEEKERIRDIRFTITFGTDEVEIKPQMQDIEAVEPFVVTDMNFEREAAE